MGLDAVEIVMDVEDHFGISIRNAEAELVRTVGDLVTLIQSRIEAAHLARCPTLSAFLRLRSLVREVAADDHMRVLTKTRISDVLTSSQVRVLWKHLDKVLGTSPPRLRRPLILRKLLAGSVIVAIVAAVLSAGLIDFAILPLTLLLAALTALALHVLTLPFRTHPPDNLSTFGAVAKRIAGTQVATERLHLRSFDAILDELRPLVVDNLGVDPSEVIASACFIEDLGMG